MKRPLAMCALLLIALLALAGGIREARGGPSSALADTVQTASDGVQTQLVLCAASDPSDTVTVSDRCSITVCGRIADKTVEGFLLESISVQISDQSYRLDGSLSCEYPEEEWNTDTLSIGGNVCLLGKLRTFSRATNPGEFDAADYYMGKGIVGKLKEVKLLTADGEKNAVREGLYRLRSAFHARLYTVFPEKEASIMSTILLGEKDGIDAETKVLYQSNGIAHLLSISALHVGILAGLFYGLLRKVGLPIPVAAIVGGIVILGYGIMVGLSVSAARAIGMYGIRLLADVCGRTYDMLTALAVMAAVLCLQNAENLKDISFLLSFGAVLGLGLFSEPITGLLDAHLPTLARPAKNAKGWKNRMLDRVYRMRRGFVQGLSASLSVTLFTLPVQLWFFYEVPVYSPLFNLLVLPFMSMLMVAGLIALIPGFGIVGTADCVILWWYETLCRIGETLPGAMKVVGRPHVWQIVLFYLLLMGALFLYHRQAHLTDRQSLQRLVTLTPLLIALLLLTTSFSCPSQVTFLDVGQGDGIVVQAGGRAYLFDCGSSSRTKVGQYVLKPYLKAEGIDRLSAVFVSHPDDDHTSGILELLANQEAWHIRVDCLVLPAIPAERRESEFTTLLAAAREADVPVYYLEKGEEVRAGTAVDAPLHIRTLHPSTATAPEEGNAYSLCLELTLKGEGTLFMRLMDREPAGVRLLLTGDVEGEGEEQLIEALRSLQAEAATASILKVAHHGSRYTTSSELLETVFPDAAIISAGRKNSYGHPHAETLKRLAASGSQILQTPENGAITVLLKEEIRVKTFLQKD